MKTQSYHFSNIFFIYIFILSCVVLKAQSPINLNTISGLKLWINGDSVKTTNYPYIDTCFSLSNNNHAFQTDTFYRPKVGTETLNGHPTIHFDGINDFISYTNISDVRTVYLVLRANAGMFGYNPILGSSTDLDFVGEDSMIISTTFANNVVKSGITKLNFTQINPTITVRPKKYSILSIETTGNAIADNFSRDRGYAFRVWDGNLAELIIFNRVLSSAEISLIENYLIEKYSPKINLGPDISISPTTSCSPTSSVSIIANPDFKSYLWSNGATTNQINVSQYGEYSVIATDLFGVNHYDTIKVIPTPKNFNYPNSILCANSTISWNTNLNKTLNQFLWQDGSLDSLFVINTPGQYSVTVTDTFGCIYNSNIITITQDNFPTTISLGNDTSLCSGNFITLTSGALTANSYTWSSGSINDSLLITNSGQYSVIVTNTNNCVAKDTIIVTIQGFAPTANFSTNIGCLNQMISFTDLSIPPSGNSISNYEWRFGDAASSTNTSTASNPLHTYTNTGIYTVNLTVTTNSNCSQSITKTITVSPVPSSTFAIGTSCQNDSTAFINQSTGVTSYSITNSYWNFGDASSTATTSISSPKHIFTNSTTYTVKLLVTNSAGCKDSIYKPVIVNAEVKADFTNGPACLNNITSFQNISIIPPAPYQPTYLWNFGNSVANTPNPIKTYTNSGVYSVTLYVDGTNGCTSSITKFVNVYLPPIASFSIPSFCSKDTVSINNVSNPQSGIMSSYSWKLNNTPFSTIRSPTLSLINPTNYSIRLTTINSFGCKDSTTHSLTVYPLPLVDFSTNPAAFYYLNEPVNFIPSISNANSYLWDMNGASTYTIQNPTETFNTEGSYNVRLNLEDQNGCKGTKTKNITVNKRSLDLAILNVSTLKDNDGFMTVVADLANYGSVPINSFKMNYQISDGGNIKENWSGTLNPNSFYTYTFNAVSASVQNSANNITCVKIEKVNTIMDDNANNNALCNTLNSDGIYVSNPLPNPTDGDITLPITLNRDLDYTISIYNSIGQIQYDETTKKGIEGLNFVTLNTSSYARGCYIIKIMIDGKVFIKKFIKTSFE